MSKSKVVMPDRFYFYHTPEGWVWCTVKCNMTKKQAMRGVVPGRSTNGPFNSEQEMYDDHYDCTALTWGEIEQLKEEQKKRKKRKAA
jgi:hypothetical protein